ncbi:MAG: S9 family peptidase, partial [Actinobacteria bacterium]|nr:S9 family peptidase [Actinomycetota bacterium]
MSQQTESFPRQSARTRHFRLGAPRQLSVSPDGHRIVFVRSNSGGDAVNRLVVADLEGPSLVERVVGEPALLLAG